MVWIDSVNVFSIRSKGTLGEANVEYSKRYKTCIVMSDIIPRYFILYPMGGAVKIRRINKDNK
jgi:hypothetical protein